MDSPVDRLNRFIAGYGAGVDAAGRPVYSGAGAMYASPREHAQMQATHNQLKADAMAYDPQSQLIRELLDEIKMRKLPGQASIPVYPAATGNFTYSHQEGR